MTMPSGAVSESAESVTFSGTDGLSIYDGALRPDHDTHPTIYPDPTNTKAFDL